GGWENDETVKEAAVREAVEEAGVRGDLLVRPSKTLQDDSCPEGLCKAAMFALLVKEELETWPEQNTRTRTWLPISEAVESCRHKWMEDALKHFAVLVQEKNFGEDDEELA
ncbi:Nudix hydrolase 16, mitochondrial, partial [Linum perenne]